LQILNEKRKGGLGVNQVVIDGMHPALLGDGLDGMNEDMAKGLKPWVDALAHREQGPLDLYGWCREAMTVASTGAVWGPMNPFKDKFYRDCFWYYLLSLYYHGNLRNAKLIEYTGTMRRASHTYCKKLLHKLLLAKPGKVVRPLWTPLSSTTNRIARRPLLCLLRDVTTRIYRTVYAWKKSHGQRLA
jgi:hypothetical protein